jgi:hypothetical protein
MFARASQTARPILRAGTKVLFRALWKQPVARFVLPTGLGLTVVGLVTVGPLVVAGIAAIAVASSIAVGREIASQRTLVAKALQRLGLGRLTGFSRFEDLSPSVKRLLDQAWEGHHTRRLADLERLTESADRLESHCAHLALADWFITHGDPGRGTHHLDEARSQQVRRTRVDLDALAIEAWSITTPNTPPPDLRTERALVRNVDTGFLLANREPHAHRLDHYNRLLRSDGFATVEAPNGTLAGLSCLAPPTPITDGPKVTVIVPAHQAESTITYALDSIRKQTWRNLEIIVVDDASTDRTADLVADIDDHRIRLVRNDSNLGTYRSRNKALHLTTGDYVTVHDADDWCHPERIATQMRHLLGHPKIVANLTGLVRATEDLTFVRRDLTHSQVIGVNTSSLLMTRETLVAFGGWDELMSAADSELIERLRALHGENAVEFMLRRTPLAVTLKSVASLTSSAATGLASRVSQVGARHLYAMAFRDWHQSPSLRADLPLARTSDTTPFPAPAVLRARTPNTHFDVVMLSSFNLPGGTTSSNLTEIAANEALGLRTGLIHNRNLAHRPHPINPKIFATCSDNTRLIAQNESISCNVMVVKYPPSVAEIPDLFPNVDVRGEIVIAINQTPRTGYTGEPQEVYSLLTCDAEVQRAFGKKPLWAPIGPAVRDALTTHHANELADLRLTDFDWHELIDVDEWRRPPHTPSPVLHIGRHGRDSEYKWPASESDLRAAYPDRDDMVVDILGGADYPKRLLRRLPSNWQVRPFDSISPRDYLHQLDVFVYFPHPDMVESFGRTILEALAVGVPVITDERFASLFGDAVITCQPGEVDGNLARLRTLDAYQNAVAHGTRAVEERFGRGTHEQRLHALLRS